MTKPTRAEIEAALDKFDFVNEFLLEGCLTTEQINEIRSYLRNDYASLDVVEVIEDMRLIQAGQGYYPHTWDEYMKEHAETIMSVLNAFVVNEDVNSIRRMIDKTPEPERKDNEQ